MISNWAVAEIRNTGRGPSGRYGAQIVHARAFAATDSTMSPSDDDATVAQFLDHLSGQILGRRFEGS
jgi:hypothetical protein